MDTFPQVLRKKLDQRVQENSLRTLPFSEQLIDFSSNDYLGFSKSLTISELTQQYLVDNTIHSNGATGSRLLTGNHILYDQAENYIASFHEAESALIFNSGYDANVGLFSSVLQKDDVILYDEYIHASIRDGIRLSYAKAYKFRHNDINNLESLVKRHKTPHSELYVAVESVFSMDGDLSPMMGIIAICEKYNCRLIADEAHALGVKGNKGEGLAQNLRIQDKIFARIMTFGKGLGCHGAAVLGSRQLKDYLVNFSRTFIYTTGLPPHSVATLLSAYKYLSDDGQKELDKLKDIVSFFREEVAKQQLQHLFIPSSSAIHCAVIPGNDKVKNISSVLQEQGYSIKPILSPTVAQGQERLRFCLHSYNTKDEITGVLTALHKAHLQ